jgi:hypothetical protein
MHMARGGDAQGGGRGDARASCASPLGTPLVPTLKHFFKDVSLYLESRIRVRNKVTNRILISNT